jgi:hypothetical protein
MEKKPKMKLEDIKVESFITSMDENLSNKIKGLGGCGINQTAVYTEANTCVTCYGTGCATCPVTGISCYVC